MLKTPIFRRFGPKRPFLTIFGQKGAIFEFSVKKRKRHFFTHFFIFQYKKNQKILIPGFSGNGHERTYERRETKKQNENSKFLTNEILQACLSFRIWVNFGQKGPFFKFAPKTKAVIIFRL